VLHAPRRDFAVREQPVHVTRALAIKAKFNVRWCQGGNQSRFQIHL
jgi:hypothetical protein